MNWTVAEIVSYLDEHSITLMTHQGKPYLNPSEKTPKRVVERVLPHVLAQRAELLAYFEGMKDARNEPTRTEIITEHVKRAVATGCTCWLLLPSGLAVDVSASLLKPERDAVEEARWVSVSGDKEWTKLPNPPSG